MSLDPISMLTGGSSVTGLASGVFGLFSGKGLGGIFGGQPRDSGNWLLENSAKMNALTTKMPSVGNFSSVYRP